MTRTRKRAVSWDISCKNFKQGSHRALRVKFRSDFNNKNLEDPSREILWTLEEVDRYHIYCNRSPYDFKIGVLITVHQINIEVNNPDRIGTSRYINLEPHSCGYTVQTFTNRRKPKTRDGRNRKEYYWYDE